MALVNFHKLFKISFVFYSVCLTGGISLLIKSLFSISKYADCAADFVYFEAIFRRNTVCISRKINEEIRKICKQDAC